MRSSSSSRACPPGCRSRSTRSESSSPDAGSATGAGPRMRFERDEVVIVGGVRHGRTLGSPVAIEIANTEWPKWEREMSAEPGEPGEGAHRATPGPRRPRRDAEVRLRRRPRRARAGVGPRDGGPCRGRRARQGARSPSSACRSSATSSRSARRRRRRACGRAPRTSAAVDASRGPLFRRGRVRGDGRRDQGGRQGGRLARGRRRGPRLRRAGRARQPRPLGPPPRRPARPGADEHPGREGASRSARRSTIAGRRGSEAHDAIFWDAAEGDLPARDEPRRRDRGRDLDGRSARRPGA